MSMQYIKTRWIDSCPDDPVWLYSEIDADRWEMRKVEVFADGQIGFASSAEHTADTRLGESPIPPIEETNAEGEFESNVIGKMNLNGFGRRDCGRPFSFREVEPSARFYRSANKDRLAESSKSAAFAVQSRKAGLRASKPDPVAANSKG
jgi:hypothetical protein